MSQANILAQLGSKAGPTFRSRLIDAGFTINQRVYVSGTALSAGIYAHDRWKAGASGCTYTFTQGSLGVPITITITAGSLQQVIEGCNMPEGGTYVLSWTGTAQARVNGGSYGSSPLAVTGITAGANTTIEFNTGTLSFPQLEVGSSATGFEYRQYGQELALCQRYCQRYSNGRLATGGWTSGTTANCYLPFVQQFRATPTFTSLANGQMLRMGISWSNITSISLIGESTPNFASLSPAIASSPGAAVGEFTILGNGGGGSIDYLFTSEL